MKTRRKKVFGAFVEYMMADKRKKASRIRKLYCGEVFKGVFKDGDGQGYMESTSVFRLPEYALDYAMEFLAKYNSKNKGD